MLLFVKLLKVNLHETDIWIFQFTLEGMENGKQTLLTCIRSISRTNMRFTCHVRFCHSLSKTLKSFVIL